jgi:Cu-Zn family superoxide dismutase
MIIGTIAVGGALGCAAAEEAPAAEDARAAADATSDVTKAVAVLHPTEGNDVRGTVRFELAPDGVQLVADVTGLTAGQHGFHIHELGDCTAPDATSAGGHFNPEVQPHGGPLGEERHVGDMGNLGADSTGSAHYQRTDRLLALSGPHSIVGRAVIVHAEPDDMRSQPTGAAGARVACGVIGITR